MGFKFLKTGKESVALAAQDKIEAQIRKEESAKAFRFYLKVGEDARITIVDSEIPKGYLNLPGTMSIWFSSMVFGLPLFVQRKPTQTQVKIAPLMICRIDLV